jgi:hypothetical protein
MATLLTVGVTVNVTVDVATLGTRVGSFVIAWGRIAFGASRAATRVVTALPATITAARSSTSFATATAAVTTLAP